MLEIVSILFSLNCSSCVKLGRYIVGRVWAKMASNRWSAARYKLDNQYDDRNHQQDMDVPAQRVRADETEQPQYK
jgi:hypothetical protein